MRRRRGEGASEDHWIEDGGRVGIERSLKVSSHIRINVVELDIQPYFDASFVRCRDARDINVPAIGQTCEESG